MGKKRERGVMNPSTGVASTGSGGKADTAERERSAGRPNRRRRKAVGISGVPGSKNDSRRCTATARKTGERCKRAAIKGGTVCTTHGGASPQVRRKATERLQEMLDPFISELHRIVLDPNTDDAVKVRGIIAVLDRTGHGPGAKLEVGVVTEFDRLLDQMETEELEQFRQFQRNGGGVDRSGMLPGRHSRALPVGGGDDDSAGQHAYDAQQQAWREYDHEDAVAYERGRIQNDGHDVVRGQVVDNDPPPHLRD